MAQIALIDDDMTEAVLLDALLSHTGRSDQLTHFESVNAFLAHNSQRSFDLVMLDRRLPPYRDYRESLSALAQSAYMGPFLLLTAGETRPEELAALPVANQILGPVQKTGLTTPEAVGDAIENALKQNSPGAD